MIKLKIANGKESGKRYMALVYINKYEEEFYLTFNTVIILKMSGKSYAELQELALGYYDIED